MGASEGAALLLVFCLLEVKRNLFGALRVRTHEPGRLFARAPSATLNTSPSHGSLATHPVSQSPSMQAHPHAPACLTRPGTYRMGGVRWGWGGRLSGATVGT